jgi:hypothetical protein
MTTYTYRCRCGQKSPGFDSKRKSRDWLASHHRREGCVRRSAARAQLNDAELAERIAWARSLRPMPVPEPSEAGPRVLTYWERRGGISALRRIAIPEPVKTDSWGRPIR